jgi:hypothetical protein
LWVTIGDDNPTVTAAKRRAVRQARDQDQRGKLAAGIVAGPDAPGVIDRAAAFFELADGDGLLALAYALESVTPSADARRWAARQLVVSRDTAVAVA